MKRVYSKLWCIFLLVVCIAGLSVSAEAVEGNYNGNIHWELHDGVLTVSGSGEMPDGAIPWAPMRDSIKEIIVSEGITSIGNKVFSHCTQATKLTLPESLKHIGKEAFFGCSKLERVVIPANNLWKIEYGAFEGCSGIREVYISDLASWCKLSFDDFGSNNPFRTGAALYLDGTLVTQLVLPVGFVLESAFCFSGCTSLESVVLPWGLKSIPAFCFSKCPNLRFVVMPASVKHIGQGAFFACNQLEYVFYGGSKRQMDKIDIHPLSNEKLTNTPWIAWKQSLGLDFWTVTVNLAIVIACFALEHRHRKYGY